MRRVIFLMLIAAFGSEAPASDNLQNDDLARVSAFARQANLPILLIVSQHSCPFCNVLREEIIRPMQISGDYDDKVVMAEILMDSDTSIRDFQGNMVSPGAIASSFKVWVTPTLLFLDHSGREIHQRMLGVNTIELYGYYLDESLAAALNVVRARQRSHSPSPPDVRDGVPGSDRSPR